MPRSATPTAARTAYLDAMVASGAELLDRSFVQMKLEDLPGVHPSPQRNRRRPARSNPLNPPATPPKLRAGAQAARGGGRSEERRSSSLAPAARACRGLRAVKIHAEPPAELDRVRSDARRPQVVERQGRRRVGAPAPRLAARDRRRADLRRRLTTASRRVRRRDRSQALVGQDRAAARGGAGLRRRAARVRHDGRRSRSRSTPRPAQERWRQAIGSEVLAAPAIGSSVVVVRTVDGRLRGFSAANGSTLWTVEQNLPALTLRGNTAPRHRRHARRQRLQQRPRRRVRARERRAGVGGHDREPDRPQRARTARRRERGRANRRQRRLRRRLSRPRRWHRPRDRRGVLAAGHVVVRGVRRGLQQRLRHERLRRGRRARRARPAPSCGGRKRCACAT